MNLTLSKLSIISIKHIKSIKVTKTHKTLKMLRKTRKTTRDMVKMQNTTSKKTENTMIKPGSSLMNPESPCLEGVLLVEGLTVNLISIGQLGDLGLSVAFNNTKGFVVGNNQEILMRSVRSKDDC